MKRIITILVSLSVLAVSAGAQDSYYAELLGRNNYYGTARSIALGGAMTALGGDLGSITFNPAGSAVNDYCQFTITPGLLFSNVSAAYDPTGLENFGKAGKTSHTKFNLPNLGLNIVLYPESSSWITSMALGVIANNTNTYLSYSTARGTNAASTFLGSIAASASGLGYDDFSLSQQVAYNANQFGEYGPEGSNLYVASNEFLRPDEKYHYVPGAVNQAAIYNTYGSKTDVIFNLGFNINDVFYFGFNMGVPRLSYRREEYFVESAGQPEEFPVIMYKGDDLVKTNYLSSTNGYKLNTDATGIYGRFGFIALPTNNLRIGAAIQTPTRMSINEEWQYTASSSYDDNFFDGSANGRNSYSYYLRTPYIVDAGVAYTIPGVGLLSLDYELTDYSVSKYSDRDSDYFGEDDWATTNYVNRTFLGSSHSVRAGVEFKPIPTVSLRAGYAFTSDPEKWFHDSTGALVTAETWQGYNQILADSGRFTSDTHAISIGAGYSSPGSFFADFALRMTSNPVSFYAPYYFGSYDVVDKTGAAIAVEAPIEKLERNVIDAVVTLGWRF